MFQHVIVGVDEGSGARDAIVLAGQLVDHAGSLTLVHVYSRDVRLAGQAAVAAEQARRERAFELLERARAWAGVDAQLRAVRARVPALGLRGLAEDEDVDLLVVGSSEHGILGRELPAHDTHEALAVAPCAVAVAPPGYGQHPTRIRKIGVGYNDSPESENAVRFAQKLARCYGADVSALEAISLPSYTLIGGPLPLENEQLDEMVEAARARIAALGDVEPHAAYGIACNALAAYSDSVDLLILGSREHGPIGGLVRGSTAQALAGTARCPLLVLTRAGRAALES